MASKGQANLDRANETARAVFQDVLGSQPTGVGAMLCERYSTGAENDNLVTSVALATVREWLGEKQATDIQSFRQLVTLTSFEYTIQLPRKTVEYDQTGAVGRVIGDAFRNAMSDGGFVDKIVFDKLTSASGAGPTGFDSAALIADSHTLGGSTNDNLTTSALSFSTYDSGVQAMQGFLRADGQPMSVFPRKLVVGPKLRKIALEIAQNASRMTGLAGDGTVDGGTRVAAATIENVFRGDNIDVALWSRLAGTQDDYWYLVDDSRPSRPMMLKVERDFELVEKTRMEDDLRFFEDKYTWSVEGDLVAAAGAYPTIYGGVL